MLTIKEIFDICKEHGVFVDLSYLQTDFVYECYIVKLYYGRKRLYRMIDQTDLEYIFANRESFEKYIYDFLEKAKEKEEKNDI